MSAGEIPVVGMDYVTLTPAEVEAVGRCYLGKWPAERMHVCGARDAFKWRFSVPVEVAARSRLARWWDAERPPRAEFRAEDGKTIEAVCPYHVGQRLYINEPVRVDWIAEDGTSFSIVRCDGSRKGMFNRPDLFEQAVASRRAAAKNLVEAMRSGKASIPWVGLVPVELASEERLTVMEIGKPQLRSEMSEADFAAEGARAQNVYGAAVATEPTLRMGWMAEVFGPKYPAAARLPDSWVWPVYFMRGTR